MTCFICLNEIEMTIPNRLYNFWDIVEILPPEDCDTSHWPWYVYEMIDTFSKNPEIEIIYDELHTAERNWEVFYYYQYKVRDYRGDCRYVNEEWIRPRSITALFI